jgi:hypothetical protein
LQGHVFTEIYEVKGGELQELIDELSTAAA